MILKILGTGTAVRDLSPFLNFLSFCLDSEWDEASRELTEKPQTERIGPREERYQFLVKGCTVLLQLLQITPRVPNLYESFAQCCGSIEGVVGWILCALVNSYDDTIRSIGIRCIVALTEATANSPDSPLSLGTLPEPEGARPLPPDGSKTNRRIQSLLAVGKGLAGMGSGVRTVVLPPSSLTSRVTYKLMWHLLKGHRSRFGRKSYDALMYLAVDDAGESLSSSPSKEFVLGKFILPDDILQGGYKVNISIDDCRGSVVPGQSLRSGLGISTVMRLLRFLSSEIKDKLLATLLRLVIDDPPSVQTLSSLSDWQPCLFHLISETLEKINAGKTHKNPGVAESADFLDAIEDQETFIPSEVVEPAVKLEARLDLCLDLYATLLGHSVREGGDKVRMGE